MLFATALALVLLAWLGGAWLRKQPPERARHSALLALAAGLGLLALVLLFTGKAALALPSLAGAAAAFMRYRWLIRLVLSRRKSRDSQSQGSKSQGHRTPARHTGDMDSSEALAVLGLPADASEDDIRAAHRRLIQQLHPDQGGSDYLAAKINRAKDILIGKP